MNGNEHDGFHILEGGSWSPEKLAPAGLGRVLDAMTAIWDFIQRTRRRHGRFKWENRAVKLLI